jgi:hypothetical protein
VIFYVIKSFRGGEIIIALGVSSSETSLIQLLKQRAKAKATAEMVYTGITE